MTRFLDWLDESAAGLIRVAYLLAGVIAVASYFSDGNVPRQFSDFLNTILPWALAGALEVHTYLTARRVRKAWQDWSASSQGSDEHERALAQLKLNLGILAGLLSFSIYNQLQYLAATWTPPHTPLTPPGFWPYVIRAFVTPSAFMAAAFLAPVGQGLALQVQSQAHYLAIATFKVATQQWKRRLRQMQQAGQDVTGALVQLVDDPAERRVIAAIWSAMQHPGQLPAPSQPVQDMASTAPHPPLHPPLPAPITPPGYIPASLERYEPATVAAPAAAPRARLTPSTMLSFPTAARDDRASGGASGRDGDSGDERPDPEPPNNPDPERPPRRRKGAAQGDLPHNGPTPMPAARSRRAGSGGAVATQEDAPAPAQSHPVRARRNGKKVAASFAAKARESLRAQRIERTIAILEREPGGISNKALARELGCAEATAKGLKGLALLRMQSMQSMQNMSQTPQRAAASE